MMMATREGGITFPLGSLGMMYSTIMVSATSHSVSHVRDAVMGIHSSSPASQSPKSGSFGSSMSSFSSSSMSTSLHSLKAPNWEMKMMMARPLRNPTMAGCGMRRTNLAVWRKPRMVWITPSINTTKSIISKRSSSVKSDRGPFSSVTSLSTTAMAPAAPEIMPGFPPMAPVMSPRKKVAYSPTMGSTPATKLNATDSGTCMTATVSPERISFLSSTGSSRKKV
mmetsp:Transcript_1199/g.4069  ORF Transcript_1199/g.4069 Transcript_1199/m.4069 type:complete len:224 (+) Transcript_1199:1303-1974(+)